MLGREGVARRSDGRRIYFNLNAPLAPFGSMAERALIDPRFAFPIPDGVADDTAAALGNAGLAAWLGLSWRGRMRPGETVLIFGATGVSGLIAVTAAKRLGAGRVIAAGRDREALQRAKRLGADETVVLAAATDLVAAYRDPPAAPSTWSWIMSAARRPRRRSRCWRPMAAWSTSARGQGLP